MPSTMAQRVELLKGISAFHGLTEQALGQISGRFIDYKLQKGATLALKDERVENFYLVLSGKLKAHHVSEKGHMFEGQHAHGDLFGARSILDKGAQESTISAVEITDLLYMPRQDLEWVLRHYPSVAKKLRHASKGRKLNSAINFHWLGQNETVYFIARKHAAYLWFRLARAMVLAILGFIAFYIAIDAAPADQFGWLVAGGVLLVGAVVWAAWEALDWRNDYYVLTNQRVVWLEQVLLRSSSRTEAPLASIQAVNTHTSLMGRLMGYGDVLVRTYTGSVLMPSVADPANTKQLIEDYVARQRKDARDSKHESIREAVRETLSGAPANGAGPAEASPRPVSYVARWQLFKTRTVQGDVIIYHKHWFTLFSSLLLPALFFLAVLYGLQFFYGGLPQNTIGWVISFVFLTAPLAVIIYRIADWQNDVYLVTPDSLMDKEKKPLGSEVTKSAPLANVLSLENHKVGILGLLFNFGIVRANVGDATLDFEDLHDPARVQQDIFTRMEALKLKQEHGKAEDERRRMTEWLRVYDEERSRASEPPSSEGRAVE